MANHQEDYHKVSITKKILVHPRSQPPHTQPQQTSSLLQLSNLDRKCPALMYLVFFYTKPPTPHEHLSDDESLFTSLKMGLEETLQVWYPAAGRLSLDPDSGRLDLACNNSGALLAEAVTQVHISELGDLSQGNPIFENLVFKPPFSPDSFCEMPLVVAQVTRFGCGGYAVGVGTNHSLFDGSANFNFLSAWASKAARRGDGEVELVEPVHERGRLLVNHGQTEQHSTRTGEMAWVTTRVMAFDHLHHLIRQAATSKEFMDAEGKLEGCKFSEMGTTSQEDIVFRTFSMSEVMVRKLKSKVTSSKDDSSCSSFEVVAAHLWKARTKAIEIPTERTVCLQFAVDTRRRMSPPLQEGFTGNAYVLSSISSTCGDLLQESLSAIVDKIKEAKRAVNEDYVRAYMEALEAPQCALLPPLPELTVVSDWRRTPYHKVDFGIGDAVCAVPLAPPLREVVYFMQNPSEVGAVDVRVGLFQKHVVGFCHYFFNVF